MNEYTAGVPLNALNGDRLLRDGFVVVEDIVPPGRLDLLRAAFETLVDRQRALWTRFAWLDAQLQGEGERFTPGFQSGPMPYFFEEMPEGLTLREIAAHASSGAHTRFSRAAQKPALVGASFHISSDSICVDWPTLKAARVRLPA